MFSLKHFGSSVLQSSGAFVMRFALLKNNSWYPLLDMRILHQINCIGGQLCLRLFTSFGWGCISMFQIHLFRFSLLSCRPGGRAMRRDRRRDPEWTEVLASPVRAELCTIIVSFLYDQHSPVRDLPVDIIYLSWSSNRIFSFTLRFREITTPSVADHGDSDDNR